ncbi:MAG: Hsp20/alpha crystallin family protein [Proteobacteria bacterium]|nr:MAG: Hsp20/alpha crystallin family protein [Pseudomonadota bacterium]
MRMLSPLSVVPMSSVFDEMDRLMDTFVGGSALRSDRVDLQEGDGHFIVSFDMPGVKRENIKVETRGQQLSITSERRRVSGGANNGVEKFERTFTLPNSIDREKIEVQYEDGVLSFYLPKSEAAKPRTFEIQSAGKEGGFFSRVKQALEPSKSQDKTDLQ